MKCCAEGCSRLGFTLFSDFYQETLCREDTKPKPAPLSELLSNNVSHTVLPLFFFLLHNFMPRFPFYVSHHLWECISTCGTNFLRANEFRRWLELLRATVQPGTESRYCSLAEVTVACIVTEGTGAFGSMFTFGDRFYDRMCLPSRPVTADFKTTTCNIFI